MIKEKGFTLVELIVGISVTAILGVILTNILVETLRGETKTMILNQIKQSSQTVLDRMSFDIREADEIVCINNGISTSADYLILFRNGLYYQYTFNPPTTTQNGNITLEKVNNVISPPVGCSATRVLGSLETLTNTDSYNGISISRDTDPVFAYNQQAGYNGSVSIKFRGSAGVKAGKTYEATAGSNGILLRTTVSPRKTKEKI